MRHECDGRATGGWGHSGGSGAAGGAPRTFDQAFARLALDGEHGAGAEALGGGRQRVRCLVVLQVEVGHGARLGGVPARRGWPGRGVRVGGVGCCRGVGWRYEVMGASNLRPRMKRRGQNIRNRELSRV